MVFLFRKKNLGSQILIDDGPASPSSESGIRESPLDKHVQSLDCANTYIRQEDSAESPVRGIMAEARPEQCQENAKSSISNNGLDITKIGRQIPRLRAPPSSKTVRVRKIKKDLSPEATEAPSTPFTGSAVVKNIVTPATVTPKTPSYSERKPEDNQGFECSESDSICTPKNKQDPKIEGKAAERNQSVSSQLLGRELEVPLVFTPENKHEPKIGGKSAQGNQSVSPQQLGHELQVPPLVEPQDFLKVLPHQSSTKTTESSVYDIQSLAANDNYIEITTWGNTERMERKKKLLSQKFNESSRSCSENDASLSQSFFPPTAKVPSPIHHVSTPLSERQNHGSLSHQDHTDDKPLGRRGGMVTEPRHAVASGKTRRIQYVYSSEQLRSSIGPTINGQTSFSSVIDELFSEDGGSRTSRRTGDTRTQETVPTDDGGAYGCRINDGTWDGGIPATNRTQQRPDFKNSLDSVAQRVIDTFRCHPNFSAKQVLANPTGVMSLFYDHICTKQEVAREPRRPYYDDSFTKNWLYQMTTTGMSLLYLQAPLSPGNDLPEWKGRTVQLIIATGTTGNLADIQPKLEWSTLAGGKSNVIMTTSIPLLKVYSILTSTSDTIACIDEDDVGGCFLIITSESGDVHMFEANSVDDRNIILNGLRNVITRLTFHLITGDATASVELYTDDAGLADGDLPRLPNPRLNMNRIAHSLLDG